MEPSDTCSGAGCWIEENREAAVVVAGITCGLRAAWSTALALDDPATVGAVPAAGGYALSEGTPCLSLVR